MDGLIVVNKPVGWTSFDVCNLIKKRFHEKKVGHTGTLDPMATGVLVVLLGRFTKLAQDYMNQPKFYVGTLELGKMTDTQDLDGAVTGEKPWDHVTVERVEEVIERFRGGIDQVPPMRSALKYKGKRLYELHRAGKVVERASRRVTVHAFHLRRFVPPLIDFDVTVSRGTYIRTLAHDVGEALGTYAYLKVLCRHAVGSLMLTDAVDALALKGLEGSSVFRELVHSHTRKRSCAVVTL